MKYSPSQLRKSLIAAAGFIVSAVALALTIQGIVPDEFTPYAQLIVALGTAYGVYRVPNHDGSLPMKVETDYDDS